VANSLMLGAADIDAWLDGSMSAETLRAATATALREWPVSKRMNNSRSGDDDPTIIEPTVAV
jgi:putative SOS response-associated peptidase YedK